MPIDFNPHIYNIQPSIIRQAHIYNRPQLQDIFIKSKNPDFEGIKISSKNFGEIEKTGETAKLYTIKNKNGASVSLSTFGATIVSIKIPDKNGKIIDVTQGYNNVTPYEKSPIGHAGGTIGPYANKISNGAFNIGEKSYSLECNKDNGKNHSHGGSNGLDVQNWKAKILKDGIEFSYQKKDMENGYPGNVDITATYKFDNNNKLHLIYKAKTDKDTILNLTNHTYFNLDGSNNATENSILEHKLIMPNSSFITKINQEGIPTGEFIGTKDTVFDFSKEQAIGSRIDSEDEQIKFAKGYDHNYCIDGYDGKTLIKIAEVTSDKSGITLNVLTNLPGFQFYTANNLGKKTQPAGKDGLRYEKRSSFCIEPQFFPNAINTDSFKEKGILCANEEYNREIIYSFNN